MIGQEKLQEWITHINIEESRKNILLLGERGCGKRYTATIISQKLNLELIDITQSVLDSDIKTVLEEILLKENQVIYLIDFDKLANINQNVLLKTLEENHNKAYFILIASNPDIILPTIRGRCFCYEFAPYSLSDLQAFGEAKGIPNINTLVKYCHTPGQLETTKSCNFDELQSLCEKIIDKIDLACPSNVLSITSKLNFKDDFTKFDFSLFLQVLYETICNRIRKETNMLEIEKLMMFASLVNNSINAIQKANTDKKLVVEMTLCYMWMVSKDETD